MENNQYNEYNHDQNHQHDHDHSQENRINQAQMNSGFNNGFNNQTFQNPNPNQMNFQPNNFNQPMFQQPTATETLKKPINTQPMGDKPIWQSSLICFGLGLLALGVFFTAYVAIAMAVASIAVGILSILKRGMNYLTLTGLVCAGLALILGIVMAVYFGKVSKYTKLIKHSIQQDLGINDRMMDDLEDYLNNDFYFDFDW